MAVTCLVSFSAYSIIRSMSITVRKDLRPNFTRRELCDGRSYVMVQYVLSRLPGRSQRTH